MAQVGRPFRCSPVPSHLLDVRSQRTHNCVCACRYVLVRACDLSGALRCTGKSCNADNSSALVRHLQTRMNMNEGCTPTRPSRMLPCSNPVLRTTIAARCMLRGNDSSRVSVCVMRHQVCPCFGTYVGCLKNTCKCTPQFLNPVIQTCEGAGCSVSVCNAE